MPIRMALLAVAAVACGGAWAQEAHTNRLATEGLREDGWVMAVATRCKGIAADLAERAFSRVAEEIYRYPDPQTRITVANLLLEGQKRAEADLAADRMGTCRSLRGEHVTRLSELSQGRLMDADQQWMSTKARDGR